MADIIEFPKSKDWSRDKVIDHLERCQMAAEVRMQAEDFEVLLLQVLKLMDASKPNAAGDEVEGE